MKPASRSYVWMIIPILVVGISLGRTLHKLSMDYTQETQLQALEVERQTAAQEFINSLRDYPVIGYDEVDKFHDAPLITRHLTSLEEYRASATRFFESLQSIFHRQILILKGENFARDPKVARVYHATMDLLRNGEERTGICVDANKAFFVFLQDNQQNFVMDNDRVFFNSAILGGEYQRYLDTLRNCVASHSDSIEQYNLQQAVQELVQ